MNFVIYTLFNKYNYCQNTITNRVYYYFYCVIRRGHITLINSCKSIQKACIRIPSTRFNRFFAFNSVLLTTEPIDLIFGFYEPIEPMFVRPILRPIASRFFRQITSCVPRLSAISIGQCGRHP